MKQINVLKPKYRIDEILNEIRVCLEEGWTGNGFKTLEFENAWKEYTNLPNACLVNTATAGLHLAVHILKKENGWDENDEIITTPLTFVSTNHAIMYENLKPVFADIDEYLCIDPDSVLKLITPKTKAVMFVGIGGNAGQLNKIADICKQYDLKLILDAAHMAGTKTNGISVGHEADVTVFSFQTVKNLPTAQCGMICFQNEIYDQLAREISWLGINKDTYSRAQGSYKWKYNVPNIGFNYQGNSIMAAMGIVGLKYLDQDNSYRHELVKLYNELLKDIKEISVIPSSDYTSTSSKHLHQIVLHKNDRDELLDFLYKNSIYPGVHYVNNLNYPMYSGNCPKAADMSSKLLTLPLHIHLTKEDIVYIVNKIKEYYETI